MSGGHYNYLSIQDTEDLHKYLDELANIARRLYELGHLDAAMETAFVRQQIVSHHQIIFNSQQRLKDVWQALEWLDSGDGDETAVAVAFNEYRKTHGGWNSHPNQQITIESMKSS